MARTEAVERTSPKTLALRRRDRELTEPRGSAYRLLLRVASGGMASVYVGVRRADASQELVAIKRSHPHLLDNPTFAKALATEAHLLARMHHSNVVGIRELEECDDDLLLVMDYVEGASLSGLLKLGANAGKPMPAPIAVRIVLDACAGLAEAHELTDAHGSPAGVVHRDVSPQNILVRVDGVARVADFGIAKLTSSDATATDTGLLKGKVNYMSPEYVVLGTQDARGDVFALGVVLWEALVGKRPFEAANEVGVLRLIAAGTAQALRRQQMEGGSWHVQLSLAQTGQWLRGLGRVADGFRSPLHAFCRDDMLPWMETVDSGFGRLEVLRHSAVLERTPAGWDRPAMPPGSHPAIW